MSGCRMVLRGMVQAMLLATVAIASTEVTAAQERPQASGPLAQFTTHVVATHYLRGQPYETHHYFKQLREGVLQGLVFRQNAAGSPLIEVEWAISEQIYNSLPDWQKDYWHPLGPAVDAGRITLPDLAEAQQKEMLTTIRGLYAQTFNLAGLDAGALPVGLEGVAMAMHITHAELLQFMRAR